MQDDIRGSMIRIGIERRARARFVVGVAKNVVSDPR